MYYSGVAGRVVARTTMYYSGVAGRVVARTGAEKPKSLSHGYLIGGSGIGISLVSHRIRCHRACASGIVSVAHLDG